MHLDSAGRTLLRVALVATAMAAPWQISPASPSQAAGPTKIYRVRIALIGLDPYSIEVPVDARVTFLNDDSNFPHEMTSACPEVDAVGRLQPGESGQTGPFKTPKTCSFHDRLNPGNPLRHGTIVVR